MKIVTFEGLRFHVKDGCIVRVGLQSLRSEVGVGLQSLMSEVGVGLRSLSLVGSHSEC